MRKKIVFGALALASAVVLAGCSGGGGDTAEPSETAIDGTGATLTIWVDDNRKPAVEAAAADVRKGDRREGHPRREELRRHPRRLHRPGPDRRWPRHHDRCPRLARRARRGRRRRTRSTSATRRPSSTQVALEAMTYDGQLYALPYSLETVALIQNVDLVGDTAPTTWDEMIQMGKDSGAERPFVINTGGQTGDAYTMYGFQTSFGAPVFVQDDIRLVHDRGRHGRRGRRRVRHLARLAGQERHRLHLDDDRLRHEQRAVQHGQGRVHDPGAVGDRRRSPT